MYITKSGAELGVKRLASETGLKRALAREIVARACGYRDWHHLTTLIGKPSAPQMPQNASALDDYLSEQGLAHLGSHEVLSILSPDAIQEKDPLRAAEDEAWNAQDAYQAGDHSAGMRHVEAALKLDPLCTHALLQKASRIDDLEQRLALERMALEGAARHVVSDQQHLIDRFNRYEETARRQWGGPPSEEDEEDETDVFAEATPDGAFYDRWPELSMRDYVRALYSVGETLVRLGRPAEAALHLRELCSQSPSNHFDSKVWLCAAHLQLGDVAGAERIAATDTGQHIRWGPKVVALCETIDGRRTPEAFAKEHPLFAREIAQHAAIPAPGAEQEEGDGQGYPLHELDRAMTPEWARAIACAARVRPEIARIADSLARRAA